MNLIGMAAIGAAVLAFGPGFLVQAGIGYVLGTGCGAYAQSKMKKLHNEICRHTGDRTSDMDELSEYAVKASQIGGVICPVIPLVSVGVGMVCDRRAEKLRAQSAIKTVKEERPAIACGMSGAHGVRL